MKTLYLDCSMGAAGDMLASALLELYGDRAGFVEKMNALGIPGVTVSAEDAVRGGVKGTHLTVLVHGEDEHDEHHHHHHGTHDIDHVIGHLPVSDRVKADVRAVYALIAEAESAVHGVPVSQVHFHEVGAMDAVADVIVVCLLMEALSPETVCASPVNVGGGTVRCAHGVLPVPAPATAKLLAGLPVYEGEIKKELCTPTGAALLRHFVSDFGPMPAMRLEKTGTGMGSMDFPGACNGLRALWGDTDTESDSIREMCCNLDDMTPEAIGYAAEQLFAAGALDVWTTAIGMKKSRPGVMLSALCREAEADTVRSAMFRHTTTLGIREYSPARHVLRRSVRTADTHLGKVRIKSAEFLGETREKPEYDDLRAIASAQDMTFQKAREEALGEK